VANPYQRADRYTHEARERGYPARSVFKLEEIDRKVRLLKNGQRVLDLGASPGSWSLYAAQRIGASGRLLAIDLKELTVALPAHATATVGDALSLTNDDLALHAPYDVVLSDMAPNTTGSKATDQARSHELFLRALDVASALGAPSSAFVGKLFRSGDFEEARAAVREVYAEVKVMKPPATRSSSVEEFLIGMRKRT
jgi:23S rRNA (uridine2552-2'-O)-methyltransferase